MPYRAFVAFSGGGAKGIVHVGALKALEERSFLFAGLAGTSAGSIVAVLAAAGFKADDMIDSNSGATVLKRISESEPGISHATDLFGAGGWWRVKAFRFFARLPFSPWILMALMWLLPGFVGGLVCWFHPIVGLLIVLASWLAAGLVVGAVYRILVGGLADVTRFRDALGVLLSKQVFPLEPTRVVRMSDFGVDGRVPLKIVSANLSKKRLQLFSAERTPDVAAADAVAASICLPVIFKPWVLGGELHVDGGIVSNLPAWPFDEERELDPEALTIAVEIAERPVANLLDRYNWVGAAISTALSGSAELNVRVSGHTEQLALPTTLELLDFDITPASAALEVRTVADKAGLRLDRRLVRLPEIYRDACKVAQAVAVDGLNLAPGGTGDQPRIRVAVGRLERGYTHSLRMSFSLGFEDDCDEHMLVPLEASVAGAAWAEKQSILELYPLNPARDMPGPGNRLRRKSRWNGLEWVMAIPILDELTGHPRLLVQLDGNVPLVQNEGTQDALNAVEETVKDFFNLVAQELRELEDDRGIQE